MFLLLWLWLSILVFNLLWNLFFLDFFIYRLLILIILAFLIHNISLIIFFFFIDIHLLSIFWDRILLIIWSYIISLGLFRRRNFFFNLFSFLQSFARVKDIFFLFNIIFLAALKLKNFGESIDAIADRLPWITLWRIVFPFNQIISDSILNFLVKNLINLKSFILIWTRWISILNFWIIRWDYVWYFSLELFHKD